MTFLLRCCFLLIALLFSSTSSSSSADLVRLTNGEWKPYLSKHLPDYGVASLVVREAFAAVGMQVEYGFFPWKRSYVIAADGEWDGSVVWVKTPEREKEFLYSDIVISDTQHLFYLRSNPVVWKSGADLKGKKIGLTLHTAYPILENLEKKGVIRIERAGNYEELFQRLLERRIDAVPMELNVGNQLLNTTLDQAQKELITYSPTVIDTREFHLIISKSISAGSEVVSKFNRGLKIIRESGLYKEILSRL